MPSNPDKNVISQWSVSAPYWEKHRQIIQTMFAPVTDALLEEANIGSGGTVLDVATGPGEPALTVAHAVGTEGRVIGVDPIQQMVDAARREAERRHLSNVRFEVAFADALPFPDDTFDAVVSRFGVMFFPSPLDGIREMFRVVRPGCKIALAVWHYAERNPFHCVLSDVMAQYVATPPLPPDSPDAFRFAESGKLLDILRQAGGVKVSERLLKFAINADLSVEDFWTLRREMSDKLRSKLDTLSEQQLTELREKVIAALQTYSSGGRISFPAEVLIVSGEKATS